MWHDIYNGYAHIQKQQSERNIKRQHWLATTLAAVAAVRMFGATTLAAAAMATAAMAAAMVGFARALAAMVAATVGGGEVGRRRCR